LRNKKETKKFEFRDLQQQQQQHQQQQQSESFTFICINRYTDNDNYYWNDDDNKMATK